MIFILILGLGAMAFCSVLVLALAQVAASADEHDDEIIARRLSAPRGARNENYAGLALAASTIAEDPSSTAPAPRQSGAAQRLPASSCTSRRPLVWLSTPSGGAKP
jgi:hypothetical protein